MGASDSHSPERELNRMMPHAKQDAVLSISVQPVPRWQRSEMLDEMFMDGGAALFVSGMGGERE